MTTLWRVVAQPPLQWRAWDEDIVVYNEVSGETHRLDPLPAEAFEILLEGPSSAEALTDRIAQSLEVPQSEDLANSISAIIQLFSDHCLIEPVQP